MSEDIEDLMNEDSEELEDGEPDAQGVVRSTPEDFKKAALFRRKLDKAKELFPGLNIYNDDRYKNRQNLHFAQLEELYGELLNEAKGRDAPQFFTQMYIGANKVTENFLTNTVGFNVTGLTEKNTHDPHIEYALKLIELEYGPEQLGLELTPFTTLAVCSAMNLVAVYGANAVNKAAQANPGQNPVQYNAQAPPPQNVYQPIPSRPQAPPDPAREAEAIAILNRFSTAA